MANEVTRLPAVIRGATMLSVKIDTFGGLNLVNREQSLQLGELIEARNVLITRNGKLCRRPGYADVASGSWHSIYSNGTTSLGVHENDLVEINSDWSTTTLLSGIGAFEVSYVTINGVIYLTNDHIIGKVTNGTYATLSSTTIGMLKNPLIPGHLIEYFNARLVIAKNNVAFFSDVGKYQQFDYKINFKQLPSKIQMLKSVDEGMYTSDEDRTYFMRGAQPAKFKLEKLFDSPAIPGTEVVFDSELTKQGIKGRSCIWTGKNGICIGLGDGTVVNKTLPNYEMPEGISRGSAVVIKDNDFGGFRYVASIW